MIKQIDPLNRITQFKYNSDGQVVEVKDAKESGDPNWSRYADFMKRHTANCGHLPPTYYRAYGYYYCSRFGAYLLPTMKNQEGKRWLKEARRYLQVYMDNGLDQNNKGTDFFYYQSSMKKPIKRCILLSNLLSLMIIDLKLLHFVHMYQLILMAEYKIYH